MEKSTHPGRSAAAWRLLLLGAVAGVTTIAATGPARARNVILFLGDAGGIPTLNAAGIYANNRPQSLFLHSFKDVALSDTSATDNWVTDSAAGMTAIVTGHKTSVGTVSQLPGSAEAPGRDVKTILEYAEEHRLSTGVITNMPIWDATPAACYAHMYARSRKGEIFAQVFRPRYGDGVDLLIGADRSGTFGALTDLGLDARALMRGSAYQFYDTPSDIPADATRAIALYESSAGDFDPLPVVKRAIHVLSRNPNGFFLMVEWDMHTDAPRTEVGLDRVLTMDALVRQTVENAGPDTLVIFTADHSFDLRIQSADRRKPLASQVDFGGSTLAPGGRSAIRVDNAHTAEEVLVAATGPAAERVRGFIANTSLFHIMTQAFGWQESP